MIKAIRKSDNKEIFADEEKKINEGYFCPKCKGVVIHHHSKTKTRTPHFKHKSLSFNCPNHTNETRWHYDTKYSIYNYLKNEYSSHIVEISLEKWLDGNQRADIFIQTKKGNKIVVEVQASIITVDEIKRRTIGYAKNSIYVLWLLKYDNKRFSCNTFRDGYGKVYRNSTRLKEMELWLYNAYQGNLYFWNSPFFICVGLLNSYSNASSYYSDGEEQYHAGKRLKTIKEIDFNNPNIKFSHFKIFELKENYKLGIPFRRILGLKRSNR
jgi:competence CoiA-like predicted nuclease